MGRQSHGERVAADAAGIAGEPLRRNGARTCEQTANHSAPCGLVFKARRAYPAFR